LRQNTSSILRREKHRQNHAFYILLQNVSEFWNVCTRATDKNGLGFSISQTDSHLKRLESLFVVLADTEDVYKNWRELVVDHGVLGVKVHDAKIVAAMKAHGVPNLLTFNSQDFTRYSEISVFAPQDVA
jgi:predicted nucleic acid-binding protein